MKNLTIFTMPVHLMYTALTKEHALLPDDSDACGVVEYIELTHFELVASGGYLDKESDVCRYMYLRNNTVLYCHADDSNDDESFMVIDKIVIDAVSPGLVTEVMQFESWVKLKDHGTNYHIEYNVVMTPDGEFNIDHA